jgi:hypothetical protein
MRAEFLSADAGSISKTILFETKGGNCPGLVNRLGRAVKEAS